MKVLFAHNNLLPMPAQAILARAILAQAILAELQIENLSSMFGPKRMRIFPTVDFDAICEYLPTLAQAIFAQAFLA